jgi:hypothetical protein
VDHEGCLARNPLIGALRLTGDGQRDTVITYCNLICMSQPVPDSFRHFGPNTTAGIRS